MRIIECDRCHKRFNKDAKKTGYVTTWTSVILRPASWTAIVNSMTGMYATTA